MVGWKRKEVEGEKQKTGRQGKGTQILGRLTFRRFHMRADIRCFLVEDVPSVGREGLTRE